MDNPTFLGADLLGDTTMLNFSLLHADSRPHFCGSTTSWGLCQKGKTASELLQEIWCDDDESGKRECAVIMVGTHDMLHFVPNNYLSLAKQKDTLMDTLRKIKDKALTKYNCVLFCTIPEIPYLAEDEDLNVRRRYIDTLRFVNKSIIDFGNKNNHGCVTPVHMAGMFREDCYESSRQSVYNPFIVQPGNIFLNSKGLDILRKLISEELVDHDLNGKCTVHA